MKVKICGLTNKEDATWAINYGADWLGVNFFKESPRHCSLASAGKWVPALPSFASVMGVFVNMDPKNVLHHITHLNLKGVQLHGDEPAETVGHLRESMKGAGRDVLLVKGFRIQDESTLATMEAYAGVVDTFLLDSFVPGEMGGTGTRFNWSLAVQAKEFGKPVILAGGLTPDNVKEAVKKVQPFAVDVASGVEKSPRKKDPEKMKLFIQNAKG